MADSTTPIRNNIKTPMLGHTIDVDIESSTTLYEGTLFCIDASGEAVTPAVTLTCGGLVFSINPDATIVTGMRGIVVELAMAGAAKTDLGKQAYAADNQTATTTAGTAPLLGPIVGWRSGYVHVFLECPMYGVYLN